MRERNKMMDHERYKELAALAASGLLSEGEYTEFRSHLKVCVLCRSEFAEFNDILFKQFPVVDLDPKASSVRSPFRGSVRAYRSRFLERARAQGIPIPADAETTANSVWTKLGAALASRSAYAYGAVLLVCLSAGLLSYRLHEARTKELAHAKEDQGIQDQIAALQNRNSILEKRVAELSKTGGETPEIETELSHAKARYAALAARYAAMESEVKDASSRAESLRNEVQTGVEREQSLLTKLKETEASLASITGELQNLRKTRATEMAGATDSLSRMRDLDAQLADANESLDRAKRLLAADHDIRDLMGARNLHITDVYDVDARGRTKKPFGRVFYTEGRSLIFYAFDLSKPRNASADRSYQLWGYQEAASHSAQSLGILFQDDQKQNRWVLKFNDPSVLSAIDAVFVTVEPPGGSEKPTGQKLLYAYVGAKPNHP